MTAAKPGTPPRLPTIRRLRAKVRERGLTLVPTRAYFRRGKVKVEIALAKGKKQHDKRQVVKARETEREMRRAERAYR